MFLGVGLLSLITYNLQLTPLYAAGTKTGGNIIISDDLAGASAGSTELSGGGYSLAGALGQTASGMQSGSAETVELGFFSKTAIAPSSFAFLSTLIDTATVNWTDVTNPQGTTYLIMLSTAPDVSNFVSSGTTFSSGWGSGGLLPNTTYYSTVWADYMESEISEKVYTSSVTRAAKPEQFHVSNAGPWNVKVSWDRALNPGPWSMAWTAGSSSAGDMTKALFGHASAVSGSRVYITGGSDGVNYSSSVYTAVVNPDGTLGGWTPAGFMPAPRYGHSAVSVKGRIYVMGGYDGSGLKSEVWSAGVSSAGVIGEWIAEAALPGPLYMFSASVVGEKIFISGGFSGSGVTGSVYRADLGSNGLISAWTSLGNMPAPRYAHAMTEADGRLYVTGGNDGASAKANVWKAQVSTDGSMGAWSSEADLPSGRYGHSMTAVSNSLFILGGNNGMSSQSAVWKSEISSAGYAGGWSLVSALPSNRQFASVFSAGGAVYAAGGFDGSSAKKEVYSAIAEGTGFSVETAGDAGFTQNLSSSGWLSSSEFEAGNLQPNSTYYFRAKAKNISGVETQYSDTASTITASAAPVKLPWTEVYITSAVVNWSGNGNPPSKLFKFFRRNCVFRYRSFKRFVHRTFRIYHLLRQSPGIQQLRSAHRVCIS